MACHHNLLCAISREDGLLGDVAMLGDSTEDVGQVDGFFLNLHNAGDHLLCQREVYLAVGERSMRQQTGEYALQVAHLFAHVVGNEINHLFTQLDTISVHLAKQDSASQRIIGARDFRRESPLEAGEQTVFNIA